MKPSLPDVGFACATILLAVFVLLQAGGMASSSTFAKVPPNIFPLMVGAGLLLVGIWLFVNALRGEKAEPATEEDADPTAQTNYVAVAFVGGGLLVQILLINALGFVLTSSLLFATTAQGFRPVVPSARAKAFAWDFSIGAVLSLIAYFGFTRGLGLQLPAGILGF